MRFPAFPVSAPAMDVDMRPITRDDVVFCHRKLDELGAPRLCDAGQPLSLRWRLIALTRNGA